MVVVEPEVVVVVGRLIVCCAVCIASLYVVLVSSDVSVQPQTVVAPYMATLSHDFVICLCACFGALGAFIMFFFVVPCATGPVDILVDPDVDEVDDPVVDVFVD